MGPIVGIHELDAATSAEVVLSTARSELDDLVRSQLGEEIGLRGYVETHDVDLLAPDGPPNVTFPGAATRLGKLLATAGLTGALPTLAAIETTHDAWERQVAVPALRSPTSPDAIARATTGKLLTDRLRAAAQNLRDVLSDADQRESAKLAGVIDATVAVSTGLVVLFALAAVLLGLDRASALDRLEREHLLVDALQRTLRVGGERLPQTRMAYTYTSATRDSLVGGDLLDAWRTDETGWVLIADASGKGIEAARHAAFVQYAIRALAAEHESPGRIVERFNRLFIETFADPGAFVVLFLARFDVGRGTVSYASAGHGTAFVRRGMTVRRLPTTGPVIGLDAAERYGVELVRLRRGDTILLATDGLTEARGADGVFLGDEGVVELFREAPFEPQAICDLLLAEVERRSEGTIRDDLAIVVIELADGVDTDDADPSFTTLEAEPRT